MVDFIDVTHGNSGFFLAGNNRQGRNTLVRSKMDYVPHHPMSVFDWRTRVI